MFAVIRKHLRVLETSGESTKAACNRLYPSHRSLAAAHAGAFGATGTSKNRVVLLRKRVTAIMSYLRAVHEGQADTERHGREGVAVDDLQPPGAPSLRERARPPRSLHQPARHHDTSCTSENEERLASLPGTA